MSHFIYDGEPYCDCCLPVRENDPKVYYDDGETDCPANCSDCGRPLDYTLTQTGVKYVLEAMRESLNESREERNKVIEYGPLYYIGSRQCDVIRDWAIDLSQYSLNNADTDFVKHYLSQTEETND